jgi:hypothetical protein
MKVKCESCGKELEVRNIKDVWMDGWTPEIQDLKTSWFCSDICKAKTETNETV